MLLRIVSYSLIRRKDTAFFWYMQESGDFFTDFDGFWGDMRGFAGLKEKDDVAAAEEETA